MRGFAELSPLSRTVMILHGPRGGGKRTTMQSQTPSAVNLVPYFASNFHHILPHIPIKFRPPLRLCFDSHSAPCSDCIFPPVLPPILIIFSHTLCLAFCLAFRLSSPPIFCLSFCLTFCLLIFPDSWLQVWWTAGTPPPMQSPTSTLRPQPTQPLETSPPVPGWDGLPILHLNKWMGGA